MNKIVVTGGSGFIGSNLVDCLIDNGYSVINYDINEPRFKQNCKYVKGNILDLDHLISSSEEADAIIHLAAEAKVSDYFDSPVLSSDTNILGTIKVLETARINKIDRVLLASTEWVYSGVTETNIVDENTKIYPPGPPHLYSSSKIAGELACINYQELYKVNYTVMRFGIPFGPRAWAATVTPIFLNKIFSHNPVTIRGEGDQFRQFVYILDLVKGIIACLKPEAANQIINLNGKRPITIIEVIRTIEEILGKKVNIEVIPDRPGDFKGYNVSSAKAKELIGWEPQIDYKDAMSSYINWYKENELKKAVA